jgi:hypothetical protein
MSKEERSLSSSRMDEAMILRELERSEGMREAIGTDGIRTTIQCTARAYTFGSGRKVREVAVGEWRMAG